MFYNFGHTHLKTICFALLFLLSLTMGAQENFRVRFNNAFTPRDAQKMSAEGYVPSGSIPFRLTGNKGINLDDAAGKKMKPLSKAIVTCTIKSEKADKIYMGMCADWFFTCYVNGEKVLDRDKEGNVKSTLNAHNHIFPVTLKKGVNHVAIYIRRGNASFYFSIDRMPGKEFWPEEERARQEIYEQIFREKLKLEEKPYLFNVSSTGCRIGAVFNNACSVALKLKKKGSSAVHYEWSLKYGQIVPEKTHIFTLRNLTPDTEYNYEIVQIVPEKGGEVFLTNGKFRTRPVKQKNHMFYIVNDMQVGSKAVKRTFDRIVKSTPEFYKADFLVSLGDMANDMYDIFDVYFDSYISYLRNQHNVDLPFVFVRGNHEFRGKESSRYANYFGRPYGAFRMGDVFYFVLDSGEDAPPVYKKNNVKMLTHTEAYFQQQREWLKKVINSPECKTAKYRVVFSHGTPFEFENKYFAKNIQYITDNAFYGKTPKCKVHLWISGHTHSPFRYDPVSDTLDGAVPRKTSKILNLTAADRKNIHFPVYVGDGPGGAGEPLSLIQVNAHKTGFTVKQTAIDGRIMDFVTFTPGKPVQVHQTGYKPYPVKK